MTTSNGKINGNILVGTWDLSTKNSEVKGEMMLRGSPESIIGEDNRKLVPEDAFKSGGKYRAIVKLQMRYEKQRDDDKRWAMGTGWLVQPDIVVTAGHCVYDWASRMGRAVRINSYIGYNGRDSVQDPNDDVQFRWGARVATTSGWLASSSNQTSDVSFIKLDSPFTGVKYQLIQHMPTLEKGSEILGIVGYPGDKSKTDSSGKEERGAQMWEVWEHTKWDLQKSNKNMLNYTISTAGGQSGSAVLRANNPNTSIGAHTYGGSLTNSASPISGRYGNVYDAYIRVLGDSQLTIKVDKNGIKYVSVPALDLQESFFDVLKDVTGIGGSIASTVLTSGSPFLGPVLGPLAATAGAALGFVSTLCESAMGNETNAESAIGIIDQTSIMHRAILGEAVLQSVSSGTIKDGMGLMRIGAKMNDYYTRNAPGIFKVGPTILSALGRDAQTGLGDHDDDKIQRKIEYTMTESDLDDAPNAFLDNLLKDSAQVGESFFNGHLGNILVGGMCCADKINVNSQTGLSYLSSIIAPTTMGVDFEDMDKDLQTLLHRALMGQATLAAVIEENKEGPEALPESLFSSIKDAIQIIGPRVLKSLPVVIKTIPPVIKNLIQDSTTTGGEIGEDSDLKHPIRNGMRNQVRPKAGSVLRALAGPDPAPPQDNHSVWHYLAEGARQHAADTTAADTEENRDRLPWQEEPGLVF